MYLVCKSVPRGWGVEQLDVVVKMLDSQPRVVSSSPTLDLTVVTLSKSLYPHCSSVPSGKIGTWDSKRANTSVPMRVPKICCGPVWTLGANTTPEALLMCSCKFLTWHQEKLSNALVL